MAEWGADLGDKLQLRRALAKRCIPSPPGALTPPEGVWGLARVEDDCGGMKGPPPRL